MTYNNFQRQLGKAGITIRGFAEIMKMNRTSLTNYAKKGEVPSHLAVIATLMGEMAEREIDFRQILCRVDIKPKKARGSGIDKFGGNRQQSLLHQINSGTPDEISSSMGGD
jgi:hypothetical protein